MKKNTIYFFVIAIIFALTTSSMSSLLVFRKEYTGDVLCHPAPGGPLEGLGYECTNKRSYYKIEGWPFYYRAACVDCTQTLVWNTKNMFFEKAFWANTLFYLVVITLFFLFIKNIKR